MLCAFVLAYYYNLFFKCYVEPIRAHLDFASHDGRTGTEAPKVYNHGRVHVRICGRHKRDRRRRMETSSGLDSAREQHLSFEQGPRKIVLWSHNYPTPAQTGYVRFQIGGKSFSMHRVVLAAFGVEPQSPSHTFANHKDLDPTNNCLENLEWCTHQENIQHSYDNNSERKSSAHKQSKPVRGKRIGTKEWVSYESCAHAARELGLRRGNISRSCRKGSRVKVYTFEFDEPNEPPLLEDEEWKKWGSGEISNLGRYKDYKGVVKTPTPKSDGYAYVRIDGKVDLMHILVAKLFLPPPENGQTQVDHKNGKGNQWWNLRWVTPSENIQHSHADPNRKSNASKISKKVRLRKVGTTEWQYFNSATEAARILGLWSTHITKICCDNERAQAILDNA